MVSNDWNRNTLKNMINSDQHIVGLDDLSNIRPMSCSITDYRRAGFYTHHDVQELAKQRRVD